MQTSATFYGHLFKKHLHLKRVSPLSVKKSIEKMSAQDEKRFDVEFICGVKHLGGVRFFKVHWAGFPHGEDSWLPEDHLINDMTKIIFEMAVAKYEAGPRVPVNAEDREAAILKAVAENEDLFVLYIDTTQTSQPVSGSDPRNMEALEAEVVIALCDLSLMVRKNARPVLTQADHVGVGNLRQMFKTRIEMKGSKKTRKWHSAKTAGWCKAKKCRNSKPKGI